MDRSDGKRPLVESLDDPVDSEAASEVFEEDGLAYSQSGSSKIGVAGAVFLILNKMIGTGSKF